MTLTPTATDGATVRASDIVYVDPAHVAHDEALAPALEGSGLNATFIADLLSAFVTHERCGVHLYRSVAERSHNPMLTSRYREFGRETEEHVAILERLITATGGSPMYVSPAARAMEKMDVGMLQSTFLLDGSVDLMTREMVMLDAVVLAETTCRANWQVLQHLAESIPDGLRDEWNRAIGEAVSQEDQHLEWGQQTRVKLAELQAKSSAMQSIGEKAEGMLERIKGWFSS